MRKTATKKRKETKTNHRPLFRYGLCVTSPSLQRPTRCSKRHRLGDILFLLCVSKSSVTSKTSSTLTRRRHRVHRQWAIYVRCATAERQRSLPQRHWTKTAGPFSEVLWGEPSLKSYSVRRNDHCVELSHLITAMQGRVNTSSVDLFCVQRSGEHFPEPV